jgi:hypothetical protein
VSVLSGQGVTQLKLALYDGCVENGRALVRDGWDDESVRTIFSPDALV